MYFIITVQAKFSLTFRWSINYLHCTQQVYICLTLKHTIYKYIITLIYNKCKLKVTPRDPVLYIIYICPEFSNKNPSWRLLWVYLLDILKIFARYVFPSGYGAIHRSPSSNLEDDPSSPLSSSSNLCSLMGSLKTPSSM